MYTIDENDKVIDLEGLPPCSAGAPLPQIVADEYTTLIAYIVSDSHTKWENMGTGGISPNSGKYPIVIVSFNVMSYMFGMPNDEVLYGHPLAERGLTCYGMHEVVNSSWIRALERINSAHYMHSKESFRKFRHFILAFHDSMFECVASGFEVKSVIQGTMHDALDEMASMVKERSR